MGNTNRPGHDWLIVTTSLGTKVPQHFHPVLAEYADLPARERRLLVKDRTPILVAPDLSIDPRLVKYFARSDFADRAANGRETYAYEIKTWLAFLWSRDMRWDEASEDEYLDFKRWRTDPDLHEPVPGEEPPVVEGVTFMKARYALDHFYTWAQRQGHVVASPVPPDRTIGRPSRRPHGSNIRAQRSKWVTPATYQTWRDVGLRGFRLERSGKGVTPGAMEPKWRGGRSQQRDEAFCDLMITSAMRRGEQSTLLLYDIPSESVEVGLSSAVTKYNTTRVFTPLPDMLAKVHDYILGGRDRAVRRAQRAERYEALQESTTLLIVDGVEPKGSRLRYVLDTGAVGYVDDLDEAKRRRLFRRDERGFLEPLSVWLGDDGIPMTPKGWNSVCRRADTRVLSEYQRLGLPPHTSISMSPHSLRFSFALYLLAALHRRIDERESYRESDPYDERRYEAAYDIVRDMLGHARVTTTKNTYLEPIKGMRRSILFDTASASEDLGALISRLAIGADDILDSGTVFGEVG